MTQCPYVLQLSPAVKTLYFMMMDGRRLTINQITTSNRIHREEDENIQ